MFLNHESMENDMQVQGFQGHSYEQVTVTGGFAQFGDQYISIYQDQLPSAQREQLQLLQSLRYPEMNARRNEIADAEYRSFQWGLNDEFKPHEGHSSLTEWLTSGSGVFHVQGKAGSGKSTFMKFAFEHPQTEILLQQWSFGKPVIMLFHSFWLAGQKIQRNWKGFLASLLSQILLADSVHPLPFPSRSRNTKHSLADWSEKELEASLKQALRLSTSPKCLFLDALDEFDQDEDIDRLLDFIDEFERSPNLCKICLSARPMEHVDRHFETASRLCLHDLTRGDIHNYVFETLSKKFRGGHEKRSEIEAITSIVCRKAEGVFLWVHYVVHQIIRGIRVNDNLESLLERIESFPPAIGDLYRQMWNLQNPQPVSHLQEATKMFSFSRHLPMALFQLGVAMDRSLMDEYLTTVRPISNARMDAVCEHTQSRLAARTAGLLECALMPFEIESIEKRSKLYEMDYALASRGFQIRRMKIKFLHSTVKNFLSESEEGRQMCSSNDAKLKEDSDMLWIQSFLVCLIENIYPLTIESIIRLVFSPVWQSAQQSHLYDTVNQICDRLVYERWEMPGPRSRCWFSDLQKATGETSTYLDFEGLLCGLSFFCTRYVLHARGTGWSAYYKGYLAMCSVLSCISERSFTNQNQDEITVANVKFLKQNGADLTGLHPYMSSNAVLAARSTASRLLHQCCVALLNAQDNFPSFRYIGEVLDILDDVSIDEELTLMWSRAENRWSASLSEGLNIIITFQGLQLHTALNEATVEFRTYLQSIRRSDKLGEQVTKLIRHRFYQRLVTLTSKVSVCDPTSSTPILFNKYPRISTELALENTRRDRSGVSWPVEDEVEDLLTPEASDIDFRIDWDKVLPFLRPLDPYEEIKGVEWKTKGALRDYFQTFKHL